MAAFAAALRADLGAGGGIARLKKVSKDEKKDRSAPNIEKDATVAAEVAEEEAKRRAYFFDTGIDRWYASLGAKTFRTAFVALTRAEAQCIVDWYWANMHNDAKRAAGDAAYPAQALAGLEQRIDACIAEHGFSAGAFTKLSTRSPKDSTLAFGRAKEVYHAELADGHEGWDANDRIVAFSRAVNASLKVTTGREALEHFLHSERIWEDLTYALEVEVEDKGGDTEGGGSSDAAKPEGAFGHCSLVVREWVDVSLESELRGFVWNNKLTCLGQYYHPLYFESLAGDGPDVAPRLAAIEAECRAFFETIKGDIEINNYIIDFAWTPGRVLLVEVNPFDGVLGSFPASTGLFTWDDPNDRKTMTGEAPFELRVRPAKDTRAKLRHAMRSDWFDIIFPPAAADGGGGAEGDAGPSATAAKAKDDEAAATSGGGRGLLSSLSSTMDAALRKIGLKGPAPPFVAGAAPTAPRAKLGLTVVLLSDTHGAHRKLGAIPDGDVLIHAGDFTHFGKRKDAEDFNAWLGELPHAHKVVVNGNHENNAMWQQEAAAILSNAVFLRQRGVTLRCGPGGGVPLRVFGTDFFWPIKEGTTNPYFGQIPARGCDVLVAHGPARGLVDGGSGCTGLLRRVFDMDDVRLVVSGHIHSAHGVARTVRARDGRGVVFANAANAGGQHHNMKHAPIVLEI